jgi:hypothetical protein
MSVCVCILNLIIEHTMSMCRIILSSVAFSGSIIIFHIILSTARFSAKKYTEHKMCFDSFYILSSKEMSFYEEFNVHRSACKYPLFLSEFNEI